MIHRLMINIECWLQQFDYLVILVVKLVLCHLNLSNFLIFVALPFVISAVFFGTKNGYYNSEDYEGDGCAHDVQRW